MKAKTKRQKQPKKKTPKKTRKPRDDKAQKKPVFAEFTNSWGFMGRKWWDAEACWSAQKNEHGKFLHPLLADIIRGLQSDYQSSVLPFLGPPHSICEGDVSNKEFWRLHQIHQKKRAEEPLNQDEQRDLKVWLQILSASLKRIEQLGWIVAAAVACGDIPLLEHLILIILSQTKPTDKPAWPKAVVVEKAYDKIVLRRQIKYLQKTNPGLKGISARLAVARKHVELLKQIQLPDGADIDNMIIRNPELRKLAPKWKDNLIASRLIQIGRICKQTGRELS